MRQLGSFLRFLVVGGAATALHYAILIALAMGAGMQTVMASSIGFVVSALVNYVLNRRYTFRSQRAHAEALPRFAATAVTGVAWNALALLVLDYLGVAFWISQVLATGIVLVWNFGINSVWAFRPRQA